VVDSQAELEASVPSSTASLSTACGAQTRLHAHELRRLLETLDDNVRNRARLVGRAESLARADDIRPRVTKVASGFERWVEVQPAMFEDVIEEELAKYDKFVQDLHEEEEKQELILTSINVCNESFLQSRREDPSVKEREHALQSLDLTYHKYDEIKRNLDEGIKVRRRTQSHHPYVR
jgi:programmed cell death 6-interacting protein